MELYIQVKRLDMNTQKLNSAIVEFIKKKKSNAAYYEENWLNAKNVKSITSRLPRTGFWL